MAKLKDSIKSLGLALNGVEPEGKNLTELLKSLGSTLTGKTIEGHYLTEILNDIADEYEETPTGKKVITDTTEVNVSSFATAQVVDENLVAANIKKDVVILGVTGTYEAEATEEPAAAE